MIGNLTITVTITVTQTRTVAKRWRERRAHPTPTGAETMQRLENLAIFDALAESEYNESGSSFTLQEVLGVFHEYFNQYRQNMGQAHPLLRRHQIRRIIEAMPYIDDLRGDESGSIDIDPECYPAMIEQHFLTDYQRGCDYNINHFFSGQVRTFRFFETCY